MNFFLLQSQWIVSKKNVTPAEIIKELFDSLSECA